MSHIGAMPFVSVIGDANSTRKVKRAHMASGRRAFTVGAVGDVGYVMLASSTVAIRVKRFRAVLLTIADTR